jgi:class 3 adenylate cyclase
VILAARIAARARGGQVLVSSTLKEITQSLGDFTFHEIGKADLKGLSGDYQLYELAL